MSADLLNVLQALQHADLGCPVFPASSSPFFLEGSPVIIDFHLGGHAMAGSDGA